MFNPAVVAAMGPLGVANISTYDIGQFRAPQNANSQPLPGMVPYTDNTFGSAFTPAQATQMYRALGFDSLNKGGHCNGTTNDNGNIMPQPLPQSWCNLSTNDSISENNRRFNIGGGNNGAG